MSRRLTVWLLFSVELLSRLNTANGARDSYSYIFARASHTTRNDVLTERRRDMTDLTERARAYGTSTRIGCRMNTARPASAATVGESCEAGVRRRRAAAADTRRRYARLTRVAAPPGYPRRIMVITQ